MEFALPGSDGFYFWWRGSFLEGNEMSEFNFNPKEWKTPNTYDNNFSDLPNDSGIYCIVLPTPNYALQKYEYEILYVGSAKNLKVRYNKHEVMRMLTRFYGYVQFYFKTESNYRNVEKSLIKKIQPKYNTQWR